MGSYLVRDAAERLGVDPRTLRALCKRNGIRIRILHATCHELTEGEFEKAARALVAEKQEQRATLAEELRKLRKLY